ncbi:hypothetical protein M427DRAFT_131011 [Gonapodya prolifera JEL478]|uniref:Multiple myeloma tumor-associated protein 2-like N-terminal domain-containing protein n=1 Tax=Gonapodya prolifera (strain JEL478) TaxID=1344416 RepID=A0A139AVP6_GONPJ|nr:hypothetical protein M427DRAFT_131011 [Gonapodya prolifera JEL478]|eukprot:KXS20811.1 hypothetical protein M427DRAFT_131011 [Gonapodya prolifera JEL478]
MAIFHPTRGGTRGGQDQFKWEDVKDDKYRENYLGHSLLAPVGRWQRNRDLTWYAKEESSTAVMTRSQIEADELRKFKEAEAEALAEALGYKGPKKHLDPTKIANISKAELEKVVKAEGEADPMDAELVKQQEATKVKGIGFGRLRNLDINLGKQVVEHVPGRNTDANASSSANAGTGDYVPVGEATNGGRRKPSARDKEEGNESSTSETKSERKRRRKREKEEKKHRKKEKKEAREREKVRDGSRERSPSHYRKDRSSSERRDSPPRRRRHDSDSEEDVRRDAKWHRDERSPDARKSPRRDSASPRRRDSPPWRRRHDSDSEDDRRDATRQRDRPERRDDDRDRLRREVDRARPDRRHEDRDGRREEYGRGDGRRDDRNRRDERPRDGYGDRRRDDGGRYEQPKRLYSPDARRFERR